MKKLIAFFEIPASDFHRAVDFYETVLGPRTKIEADGKGWFAVFTDSEGNRIGIYAEK